LISVLISIVFQPPSFTIFESETEIVRLCSVRLHSAETKPDYLCRDHLGSVSAESNSASAESSKRLKRSHYQDAIKQIRKYAKFLKELCMHKRKKLREE
ncbi:hypothetical protein CR513_28486, partial [Mucuna pruriens]